MHEKRVHTLCRRHFLVWPDMARLERSNRVQKWEYLTVRLDDVERWSTVDPVPHLINDQELKNWKKTSIHIFISQLGEDGWEMTGVLASKYLFFKRPKP